MGWKLHRIRTCWGEWMYNQHLVSRLHSVKNRWKYHWLKCPYLPGLLYFWSREYRRNHFWFCSWSGRQAPSFFRLLLINIESVLPHLTHTLPQLLWLRLRLPVWWPSYSQAFLRMLWVLLQNPCRLYFLHIICRPFWMTVFTAPIISAAGLSSSR